MNRRLFFTALAGAAPAAALPKPEAHQVRMRVLTPFCAVCHLAMECHGSSAWGQGDFFTCEAEWCPNFRVPVDVPTLAMPAADPAKVAAIREREREGEEAARRRREELAADWEALHHPYPSFTPAVPSCPHCGIPQAEGNEGVFACPAGCRGVTIRIRSRLGPTLWGRRLDA